MVQRNRQSRLTPTAAVLLALLGGCAATSGGMPGAPVPPPSAGEGMSPAGESLLQQARDQRESGEPGEASMTLERAIRIEPDQPALWLELARVHLDQGNSGQAEQLARKAASLARPDSPLQDAIAAVIEEARRRQANPL